MLGKACLLCKRSTVSGLPWAARLRAAAPLRALSAGAGAPLPPPPPPQQPPWWVGAVNASVASQPLATLGAYTVLDAGGIAGLFALFSLAAVEVPVELALAYGVSRLLRRVRMPVDLAAAALLARAAPVLTEVRIMDALSRSAAGAPPPASALGRAMAGAGAVVNRYGLAYLVASRCVGLASVGSLFACLRAGVDVQGALAALDAWAPAPTGLADAGAAAGKAAGWWAAAAVTSAPLLPANVLGAALVGRAVERYRRGA